MAYSLKFLLAATLIGALLARAYAMDLTSAIVMLACISMLTLVLITCKSNSFRISGIALYLTLWIATDRIQVSIVERKLIEHYQGVSGIRVNSPITDFPAQEVPLLFSLDMRPSPAPFIVAFRLETLTEFDTGNGATYHFFSLGSVLVKLITSQRYSRN